MPRKQKPLDPTAGPVTAFAQQLRDLRDRALEPEPMTYRRMSKLTNYSHVTLSKAAGGERFPSWEVTKAYVRACGGDVEEFQRAWKETEATLKVSNFSENFRAAWSTARMPYSLYSPDSVTEHRPVDDARRKWREVLTDQLSILRPSGHRHIDPPLNHPDSGVDLVLALQYKTTVVPPQPEPSTPALPEPPDGVNSATTTPEEFAALLAQVREATGRSYRDIARATDIPVTTVFEMCRPRRSLPETEATRKFLRACGLDEQTTQRWLFVRAGAAMKDTFAQMAARPAPPTLHEDLSIKLNPDLELPTFLDVEDPAPVVPPPTPQPSPTSRPTHRRPADYVGRHQQPSAPRNRIFMLWLVTVSLIAVLAGLSLATSYNH